jgi:hypothetical protein
MHYAKTCSQIVVFVKCIIFEILNAMHLNNKTLMNLRHCWYGQSLHFNSYHRREDLNKYSQAAYGNPPRILNGSRWKIEILFLNRVG